MGGARRGADMDGWAAGDGAGDAADSRALAVLEQLLALDALDLQSAFELAAHGLCAVLHADKVDVFVREDDQLVAVGTSDTPMGRRERELGLDRLPLERCGRIGQVYTARCSFLSPRSDQDPAELPELVEQLGIRSSMGAPLVAGDEALGALLVTSGEPEAFDAADLRFLEAIAGWIGLVGHRAALVEQLASRAAQEGFRQGVEEALAELTPRKREVAALVAQGLTNAEIARQLVLSEGTVANHVQDILQRLGVRRRTQLAAWIAARQRAA